MHADRHPPLPPAYALPLLKEVWDTTGCFTMCGPDPTVLHDSEVRMACPGRPLHQVLYAPAYRQHWQHFLVNGAFKILRFWAVPPDHRVVPAHEVGQRLPPSLEAELAQVLPPAARDELPGISQWLYAGTVQQLTSMPLDLRVERIIASQVPEHHPLQAAYLQQQVVDFLPHFNPVLARHYPASLYALTTSMNVAFSRAVAELADVPVPRAIASSPFQKTAADLLAHLDAGDTSYRGDVAAIDAWASTLGIRSWYEWQKFPVHSRHPR